jgi:hypothetical protein
VCHGSRVHIDGESGRLRTAFQIVGIEWLQDGAGRGARRLTIMPAGEAADAFLRERVLDSLGDAP